MLIRHPEKGRGNQALRAGFLLAGGFLAAVTFFLGAVLFLGGVDLGALEFIGPATVSYTHLTLPTTPYV